MKSAYELALERLKGTEPPAALTEAQKVALAEIDTLYQSKIAEKEVYLGSLMVAARNAGQFGEVAAIEVQRAREIARLRERAEEEKEKIRQG